MCVSCLVCQVKDRLSTMAAKTSVCCDLAATFSQIRMSLWPVRL